MRSDSDRSGSDCCTFDSLSSLQTGALDFTGMAGAVNHFHYTMFSSPCVCKVAETSRGLDLLAPAAVQSYLNETYTMRCEGRYSHTLRPLYADGINQTQTASTLSPSSDSQNPEDLRDNLHQMNKLITRLSSLTFSCFQMSDLHRRQTQ